jgi:hypothetical protein
LRDISFPRLGVFYCSVVSSDFPEFVFDFVVGRFLIGVVIPAANRAGTRQIGSAIRPRLIASVEKAECLAL